MRARTYGADQAAKTATASNRKHGKERTSRTALNEQVDIILSRFSEFLGIDYLLFGVVHPLTFVFSAVRVNYLLYSSMCLAPDPLQHFHDHGSRHC